MNAGYPQPEGARRPISPGAMAESRRKERDALQAKLREALVQDPEIQDKANISATITEDREGESVHLLGKLPTAKGKERAEEIVRASVPEGMRVVNEIVVD